MAQSLIPELRVYSTLAEASNYLAKEIVQAAREYVAKKGVFTLVLSGGKTPGYLYSILAAKYSDEIPWRKTHLFLSDERYVPLDHPLSNFAMVHSKLVSKVSLPPENLHPVPVDMNSPEKAARSYEKVLKEFLQESKEKELSMFDVVLLGMGEDGHTASLFPGSPVLYEKRRLTAAVTAPSSFSPRQRITLTLPAINASEKVFFLVAGAKKRISVSKVFEKDGTSKDRIPAAMVIPKKSLIWFLDREASKN